MVKMNAREEAVRSLTAEEMRTINGGSIVDVAKSAATYEAAATVARLRRDGSEGGNVAAKWNVAQGAAA
jgi:hypothetical protein